MFKRLRDTGLAAPDWLRPSWPQPSAKGGCLGRCNQDSHCARFHLDFPVSTYTSSLLTRHGESWAGLHPAQKMAYSLGSEGPIVTVTVQTDGTVANPSSVECFSLHGRK